MKLNKTQTKLLALMTSNPSGLYGFECTEGMGHDYRLMLSFTMFLGNLECGVDDGWFRVRRKDYVALLDAGLLEMWAGIGLEGEDRTVPAGTMAFFTVAGFDMDTNKYRTEAPNT